MHKSKDASARQNSASGYKTIVLLEDAHDGDAFKVFSRQEVVALREKWGTESGQKSLPEFLFRVLVWQVLVATAIALTTWLSGFGTSVVLSAFYGALCAVLPSALVARTVFRQGKANLPEPAGGWVVKLLILELLKVALTIGMLASALLVLAAPNWIAIVAGFVVTLKVYWVVALVGLRQARHVKKIGINE